MIANPEVKAFRYDPYSKVSHLLPLSPGTLCTCSCSCPGVKAEYYSPGVESGVLRPRLDEAEQAGGHPAGQGEQHLGAHTGHPGQVGGEGVLSVIN